VLTASISSAQPVPSARIDEIMRKGEDAWGRPERKEGKNGPRGKFGNSPKKQAFWAYYSVDPLTKIGPKLI
jgi:hypothetical protein